MTNKFIALLLLVSLVAAVQGDDGYVTPEECYNYCFHAMLMPAPVADRICRWRCQFPMWTEHVLNFENVYCPANVKGKAGNNDPATKVEGEMEKVSKG
ncbi:hypothetical protein QL285_024407 [Trifolium repens]|nr:hypothetical protein QL285_024407 [Trifolium repens]